MTGLSNGILDTTKNNRIIIIAFLSIYIHVLYQLHVVVSARKLQSQQLFPKASSFWILIKLSEYSHGKRNLLVNIQENRKKPLINPLYILSGNLISEICFLIFIRETSKMCPQHSTPTLETLVYLSGKVFYL